MFNKFKEAVARQLDSMTKEDALYRVDVSPDAVWQTYLSAFPAEANPVVKERTEHDCQACKRFIKSCGNVVAIKKGAKVSVWDVKVPDPAYQAVADKLAGLVKESDVYLPFLRSEEELGVDFNMAQREDGEPIKYEHLFYKLPAKFVKNGDDIPTALSQATVAQQVFSRGLDTIMADAINTVLDLIDQKSIYRGEEFKQVVQEFASLKTAYDKLRKFEHRQLFTWSKYMSPAARIRNTAIGTLLVDLSEGMDITAAVSSFEAKVAPANYKRPSAVITKRMIDSARATVKELGLEDALPRRFATLDDITINNVLFADRDAQVRMSDDPFGQLLNEVPVNPKAFDKVEEVPVELFMSEVLPTVRSLELQLESRLEPNLVSLVAPVNKGAGHLFKWDNNFSWAYNGEVADSDIKRNVKSAGGSVTGVLRFSIQWNENGDNQNDFDAHCYEPKGGTHIYYGNRHSRATGGTLDVDIITPGKDVAVENITWANKRTMPEGIYSFSVNNFSNRGGTSGFRAEIEFDGQVYRFAHERSVRQGASIQVASVRLQDGKFSMESSMDSTLSSKEVWGVATNQFHKVSVLMYSPNHWDGAGVGNRHWFFMLEGCKSPVGVRGFFNEFLRGSLEKHRKVFEVLGSKMRTEPCEDQLSGLGFSSTQRNHVLCRVTGSCTRVVKIVF